MKITYKLSIAFLLIPLLIWVVGYFAVNASEKTLRKFYTVNFTSLAVEILDKVDRAIYSRIEIFQEYSKDLTLQEAVYESNQEFERLDNIQEHINKKDREWTSAPKGEITPFMKNLINNRLARELREKMEFHEEKHGYKVYAEIFTTNKHGANVAQTGKTSDYGQDDEEWWQAAKRDSLYVGDVEYDESAGVYSTDIGIRVDDEDGDFIGVINVVLNIEEVINIMDELTPKRIHEEHKLMKFKLITKKGKLIYSTGDFKVLEDVSYLLPRHEHPGRGPISFIKEDHDNDEILSVHTHSRGFSDFKGLGWILIVEHNTEEIFAPVIKLKKRILMVVLSITLLALLLGIVISRFISSPIKRLRDAAIEIGKGKLDARIEIESGDEIGELADSFNKMSEDLQKTTVSRDLLVNEVNERKQAEEALKQLNEELEQRVEKRTRELREAQEQLIRREKLAAVGQLASSVGHELRNPLGVISNSVYFLNMKIKDADKKVEKHLGILQAEVNKATRIIADLLDFARAKPPALVKGNMNTLVGDSLSGIQIPENVIVETQPDENLPEILIDPDQIRQVFLNFIYNALQAMPQGGRLDIKTRTEDGFVEVIFKDTGGGIPEENLQKIFEPLFTTRPKGIGLGLAIANDIVDKHEGRIEVESEVDVGTTFTVKLPIKIEN